MRYAIRAGGGEIKPATRIGLRDGFSLLEMMVSILVLTPVMGAALTLFSVGVNQQSSEQSSVEAIQEARSGLDMMTMEIAQAGAHGDRSTTTTSSISASTTAQAVNVGSCAVFG